MTEVTVRRASLADVEEIGPLFDAYRQFYEQRSDPAAAFAFLRERLKRDESVVFIAHAAGRAAGFTQLYPSFSSVSLGRIFVLNDLFVAPAARKLGIGRRLLDAATNHARQAGAIRLTLSTAATNATAQSLYESAGWKRDERFYVYNFSIPGA